MFLCRISFLRLRAKPHPATSPRGARFLLSALVAGAVAAAQTPPAPSTLKKMSLEQLLNLEVISVSKRPERLADTASAIQVITAEDIRSAGATQLGEALRLATNLEVAQVDSRQWAVSARGFNNTIANKLLVLMDGRMLYTPLYAGVFWDVQDTLLEDTERIEVISGPGATQWGANAVNGVINIISKPAKDTQGGLLFGGGGNELLGFGGARYGGEAAPGVHYRVYGKYFDRDQSVLRNGGGWPDAWHMAQGGFRVDWDGTGDRMLTLQGDAYAGKIAQPLFDDIAVSGGNLLGRWTRSLAPDSELRLQAYFDHTHRRIPGSLAADIDIHDLDFQHRLSVGGAHDVVWGLGFRVIADDIENSSTLAFLPSRATRRWFTAFAQDEFALVPDALHLTFGTKLEHNDYTGFEVQPTVRLLWKPGAAHSLWGSISRAIRAPSRIDRDLFSPDQPPFVLAGGAGFDSEKLIAYELGYRVQPGPRLGVSLALFYHDYDDLRSLEPVAPPAPVPVVIANGIEGNSHGAELTVDFHATDNWRLQAGWNELRVHSARQPGSFDFTSVRSQSLDPNHQVHLRSTWDLPANFELDLTARYVSRIVNQSVPGYTELDVRVGWRPAPAWEFSLVGQNLLHPRHGEFGALGNRREIERSVLGKAAWRF